jgi:flavodoxin
MNVALNLSGSPTMRTLIVYYSRTGTTEKMANLLAERLGADLEPLVDPTSRAGIKGFWSAAKDARTQATPELGALVHNPEDYDLVLVGTPVWAGTMSVMVRSFLTHCADTLPKVGLFATTSISDLDETLEAMAKLLPNQPVATLGLKRKLVTKDQCADQLDAFAEQLKALAE